jgi:sugar diacid utilization regulator
MNALPALPMLLLMATFCVAEQVPPAELQHKADEAHGADCVHLSLQAARQSVEDGAKLFNSGDVQAAYSALDLSLRYAQRSVDCALESRKAENSAEIELRRLVRRLGEIRQQLDSEERQQLERPIEELERQRSRLLLALFGPNGARAEKQP